MTRMLAKTGDTLMTEEWSGFPRWYALVVQPGREIKAADFLIDRAGALIYLPLYVRQVRQRGRRHVARSFALIPGLLFAPVSITDLPRRDFAFALAHVHGFRTCDGRPTVIPECEIEKLRKLEGRCNGGIEPPPADLHIGDRVRLKDDIYRSWGQAKVIKIDADGRIDVEFPNLFGRATTLTVPAAECERMQPFDASKVRAHRSKLSPAA
jgi:transcription antitermination factor NusG